MDDSGNPRSARKSKPIWTSAEESRLIELYRQFRLLWDYHHPGYYKRDQRECALQSITNQMGEKFSVANVKEKIKTLRDYYVKEKKKVQAKRKHNSRDYVPRWEHFGSLEFLRHCTASTDHDDTPPNLLTNVPILVCVRPPGALPFGEEMKWEPSKVYPAFAGDEGPDRMILPSSTDVSSDDEVEPVSQGHYDTRRVAQGISPEQRPNLGLLKPAPSAMTTAHAELPTPGPLQTGPSATSVTHSEQLRSPGLLQSGPSGMPMVHAEQRPNPGLLQHGPSAMPMVRAEQPVLLGLLKSGPSGMPTAYEKQRPNPVLRQPGPPRMSLSHAEQLPNAGLLQPGPSDTPTVHVEQRPNPGLLQPWPSRPSTAPAENRPNPGLPHPEPSGMSTANAGPSAADGPTQSAERMRAAASSPAESSEGSGEPLVTPGPGLGFPEGRHQLGLNPGAIPPCPVPLEDDEVLLYQQLMTELGRMNTYDQDVVKARMQEALIDVKHNFKTPSPGGPAL